MRRLSVMMLSEGSYDRRYIMAIAVQQIHPVAHLPLVLGVLRRLEVATVIDRLLRPTRRTGSRMGVGPKPWCSPFSMGIMPSLRWGKRLEERGMVSLQQPVLGDFRE